MPEVYHPAPAAHKAPAYHAEPSYEDESPKPYSYEYAVADDYSKAAFNAHETSDGNAVTGGYSVVLPDGRIQHVKYTADHYNGFVAEVRISKFIKITNMFCNAYLPSM
ncbi:MAG: chitin-binding domain-containing protein, partial [Gammaproteobacteria bacterium]|nr:chitin-binding domain-containing protein [Gammaproteobacteria bacterium]